MALADAWDVMTSERPYTTVPHSPRPTPSPSAAPARAVSSGRAAVEALISVKGGA